MSSAERSSPDSVRNETVDEQVTTRQSPASEPPTDSTSDRGWYRYVGQAWRVVALAFSLYHLYIAGFGAIEAHRHRIIHLSMAVVLALLIHPDLRRLPARYRRVINGTLAVVFGLSLGYVLADYDYLVGSRFQFVTPVSDAQLFLGVVFIVGILELCRRVTGWVLPLIVIIVMVYPFVAGLPGLLGHGGYNLAAVVDAQYLTTFGVFGIPLGASADYIALFVIFGAFLERSGMGSFIIDLASSVVGRFRGGPAKVAVVASAMTGSISGSAPANVLTTGTMTIPLMKRIGYPPRVAGGIEAAASTGGVLMPPVMGSVAFIMAQYTGISYGQIMLYALVPACLYFFGLLLVVHWSALRHNVRPVHRAELPSWRAILVERGHLFVPIIILVTLIALGYSPQFAIFYGIISVVLIAGLRRRTRMGPRDILAALENGAKTAVMIALATAAAGMIVGVLELTGVGTRFAQGAAGLIDGLFLALLLTAVVSILLGLGVPPSASYIVQVAVTIPVLITFVTAAGVSPETAVVVSHFFVMYYAVLAVLTPPDALAAIAAAGIAGSSFLETAVSGIRVAFVAFFVPFVAVYRPGVLLIGTPIEVISAIAVAMAAVFTLSLVFTGYFVRGLGYISRSVLLGAGLALVVPWLWWNIAGGVTVAVVCGYQLWRFRDRTRAAQPEL